MALCSILCPRIPVRFRPKPVSPFFSKPMFPLSYRVYSSLQPTPSTKGTLLFWFMPKHGCSIAIYRSCWFLKTMNWLCSNANLMNLEWLFVYDRWTWKCKHWVSGYGNHGFSNGTEPHQSWVINTLFCYTFNKGTIFRFWGGSVMCKWYNSTLIFWCLVVRCDVSVWNRTKSKCDPLIGLGAK